MAEWTDPASLKMIPTDYLRSATINAILDDLEWLANPPQTVVRLTSSQSVDPGVNHTVTFPTAVWSDNGATMFDPVAAPSKVIITRAGTFDIQARALWDAATDGTKRAIFLYVNGEVRVGVQLPAVDPTEMECNLLRTNMDLNDEVEMVVRHLNGDPLNLLATRTRLTVAWATQQPTGETV